MTTKYKTLLQQCVGSRKGWIGRVSFFFTILAYGLFLIRYFLHAGSESACDYIDLCYKTRLSHDQMIINAIIIFTVMAVSLFVLNILRNPATKSTYHRFLKYFIPIAVVLQYLSLYPIALAPVALSTSGEEILFIPTALLLSFIFIFSSLYIAFSKKRSLWIVAPVVFCISIALIVGHYFVLSAVSGMAKEKRDFFLEHCEIEKNENFMDKKMKCF